MKRQILLVFMAVILATNMLVVSAFGTTPEQEPDARFDIDGADGVTLSDVVLLARHVAQWEVPGLIADRLDVNQDGDVNLMDVVYLAQVVAGWDMSLDMAKNNPQYTWPQLAPGTPEAGTGYNTDADAPVAQGALSKLLLSKESNTNLPFSIACHLTENTATALLPAGTALTELKLTYAFTGSRILYNGVALESGVTPLDFTKPVELTLDFGTSRRTLQVYIMTLNTGMPSMSVVTENMADIDSKVDTKACNVFAGGGDYNKYESYAFAKNETLSGAATIKGRGWTSWYYYPKKSYTLKFESKQELLGLPSNKEWVLAANYADRSLFRNAVAMELAHNVNMETVMDVRFVDLWVNGEYQGNYQLVEKIEVHKNRVAITDFDAALEPDQIGYIVETNGHNKATGEFGTWTNGQDADRPSLWQKLNNYATLDPISGDMFFNSLHYSSIFNVNKPSDKKLMALDATARNRYLDYIYNYIDKMEGAIQAHNYTELNKYMDLEAMARWYIVEELAMNTDSKLHCSCYMYKDAGGKMKMGPVWDFDLGFGNGKYAYNASQTYLDGSTWFADLLALPQFKSQVKQVWNAGRTQITQLPDFITKTGSMLEGAQNLNYSIWSITQPAEHTYEYSTEQLPTYAGQVKYLKEFTQKRITYMDNKISKW